MRKVFGLLILVVSFAAQAQEASYTNNLKMRTERRVGVGAELGGSSGLAGALLELNMEDENAALVGIGFGNTYSTFSLAWKHSFEGKVLTPYTTLGWSRWYASGGATPTSHILDEMLTASEKSEDRFNLDLATAGIGAQYQELDGELAGASFFGELNMDVAPFRGKVMPTAAFGAIYFF